MKTKIVCAYPSQKNTRKTLTDSQVLLAGRELLFHRVKLHEKPVLYNPYVSIRVNTSRLSFPVISFPTLGYSQVASQQPTKVYPGLVK